MPPILELPLASGGSVLFEVTALRWGLGRDAEVFGRANPVLH
jgi:hypothetical protein